jgi:hypothetical protein
MTQMPGGVWVGVEGTDVFIGMSRPPGDVQILSAGQAEMLAELLRCAAVLSSRQELAGVDVDCVRAAIDRAMEEAAVTSSEAGR